MLLRPRRAARQVESCGWEEGSRVRLLAQIMLLPVAVVLAMAVAPSRVSATTCVSGQTGPPFQEASFFTPPNDEYCTFVDLTGCSQALRARWSLYWPDACALPAQVYFRAAVLVSGTCYKPGAIVGSITSMTLSGPASTAVTHQSPNLVNPGAGLYFICFNLTGTGTCPAGPPMLSPKIRWDATCDACKSYNSYPGSGGEIDLCGVLPGNPVMWVEPASVGVEDPGAAHLALAGARPNPALGAMNVWFTLASDEPATLELFDAAGRRVFRRAVGTLGPGDHVVTFDGTSAMHAGLYFLRLEQAGVVLHERVAITR